MGNVLQLVTLKIENEEYAIDITKVKEIIKTIQITPIPNNISESNDLEGIINLRGAVIPIINLRKKFNMDVINNNDQTRIIVLDMGPSQTIGIIVDAVSEVLRVPVESTENPPQVMKNKQFISKVIKLGDRLILLLNVNSMFGNVHNNVLMIEE